MDLSKKIDYKLLSTYRRDLCREFPIFHIYLHIVSYVSHFLNYSCTYSSIKLSSIYDAFFLSSLPKVHCFQFFLIHFPHCVSWQLIHHNQDRGDLVRNHKTAGPLFQVFKTHFLCGNKQGKDHYQKLLKEKKKLKKST